MSSDVTAATELLDQRPPAKAIIADKGYDADRLRSALRAKGTRPVIPGRSNRKKPIRYDEHRYRERWRIEAAFCRLKDFRRIATRYDRLAANFLSAVALAITIAFWV
jgi:transposase